jgi:uncharacterized membrane protein HdeD (DUF308 family)
MRQISVTASDDNTMDEQREHQLRPIAARAQNRISGKLGDIWWAFMLRGVFAGLLGICALVWPTTSFTILARLVGLYCLVDGLLGLVGALRVSDRGSYLLQAAVSLLVGAVLLFLPGASVRTLLRIFGVWALFTGGNHILSARRANLGDSDSGLISTLGVATGSVGLVLLIWPGIGLVTISWSVALVALVVSSLLIFVAVKLKRLKKQVDELRPVTTKDSV